MPPAETVDHLLVGEHGGALRAPVHFALLAKCDSLLQHAQEEPLVPAVVFRLATGDFAPPVVTEPEAAQHAAKLVDVRVGPIARRNAVLDRGIFSRQTERVPAHRMQHVESAHPLVARHCVANRVVAHVAHVQSAGGIRQHFEHVVFLARGVAVHGVETRPARPKSSAIWIRSAGDRILPRSLSSRAQLRNRDYFLRALRCLFAAAFRLLTFTSLSYGLLWFLCSSASCRRPCLWPLRRARRASTARPRCDGRRPACQSASRG